MCGRETVRCVTESQPNQWMQIQVCESMLNVGFAQGFSPQISPFYRPSFLLSLLISTLLHSTLHLPNLLPDSVSSSRRAPGGLFSEALHFVAERVSAHVAPRGVERRWKSGIFGFECIPKATIIRNSRLQYQQLQPELGYTAGPKVISFAPKELHFSAVSCFLSTHFFVISLV
jgi:hypothetical protein